MDEWEIGINADSELVARQGDGEWVFVADLPEDQQAEVLALLTPEVMQELQADFNAAQTPTATPSQQSTTPQSGQEIPPPPSGWLGPWPPMTEPNIDPETRAILEALGQDAGEILQPQIDWEVVRKAHAEAAKAESGAGPKVYPNKQAALDFAAQAGLDSPQLQWAGNGWSIVASSDATEGQLYRNHADAAANAPPGFRPTQLTNGYWAYEREPEASGAPGSWDDLVIQRFMEQGPTAALEADRFRDQIENNSLSLKDAISLGLQVAGNDPKAFMDIVRLASGSLGGVGTPQADAFTQAAMQTARQIQDPFANEATLNVIAEGGANLSPEARAAVAAGTAGPNTQMLADAEALVQPVEPTESRTRIDELAGATRDRLLSDEELSEFDQLVAQQPNRRAQNVANAREARRTVEPESEQADPFMAIFEQEQRRRQAANARPPATVRFG